VDSLRSLKLGEVASIETGKLDSNAATKNGKYPFFTCSPETLKTDTYSFDTKAVLLAGNNAAGIFPIKYYEGKFDAYQRTYVIRSLDENQLLTRYLFYALNIQLEYFRGVSTGVTTKFLTLSILNDLRINIPSFDFQGKAVSLLSPIDDLLELNLKFIKVWEEISERIYNEWFVHFKFPEYKNAELIQTPNGLSPKGWMRRKISDFVRTSRGKSYRTSNLVEENGIPFITLKCVNRGGGFRIEGLKQFSGEYEEEETLGVGDVFLALTDMTQERRVVGRVGRVPDIGVKKFVYSMDLLKLVPLNEYDREFFYGLCRYSSMPSRLKEYANGVNVLHLSQKHVNEYEFCLPPESLRKEYSEIVLPMYNQIDILMRKNMLLGELKELTLPKVISGDLDVSGLDIDVLSE